MLALTKPLLDLAEREEITKRIGKQPGMIQISGCVNSQKTHLMYALSDGLRQKVIVCSDAERAKRVFEEYKAVDAAVCLYPAKDLLFYQADLRSKEILKERMQIIRRITDREKMTVVTTIDAFMDSLPERIHFEETSITILDTDEVNLDEMATKLVEIGYVREEQVDAPGQFAVRGGIVDIYPLTEDDPIRIELFGDEVDSIRTFDVDSQRSIEKQGVAEIFPVTEFPEYEKRVSFLQYFDPKHTVLFLDDPVRVFEKGTEIGEEFKQALIRREEYDYHPDGEIPVLYTIPQIAGMMKDYSTVGMSSLERKCKELPAIFTCNVQAKGVNPYNNSFELLTRDLRRLKKNGHRVVLISGSRTRAKRLAEDLRDYNLNSFYSDSPSREVQPGELMTMYGHIEEGYEYPFLKFSVIAESDVFGKRQKKKRRKVYEGRKIQDFTELKPGDYVVHESHGLGIYRGIEKILVDRISKDYIKISYAGTGNLYIPATQLNLIQKYADADAKKPKLNRLGSSEWNRTKARVKSAVQLIAKDLVELYAVRQQKEGFPYDPDTVWQQEFEEMFPFEETADQLLAIEAVKQDMESAKIMDRLICGDVGYGKTEIAIRAAFKAVMSGKQVVYLVPTTILAQQHYNTFVSRMQKYPVKIDLMCRFKTAGELKKTAADLKAGRTDIVIGTHRVLSQDVAFKDLGLLIIDEEQRFGVQHKEKIKKMKENVDVMTLTATPIPRTLHMSLIGIRDMSVLEEAPEERLPIQTYVMEYNEELVREAIEREALRGGQVYYVYNRVEDIADVAGRIQSLVPDLQVAYAHGKMNERQLERIMVDFINGEIDVLVSTTIIETGLDISNVNTMIIHDADKLGLSQLYQLRGRVGRSNRMAYAFLFYRRDKLLKEVAEKRLSAIREFTDLGSGIRIAMRDLEIRGAGNLLGEEQHGHMEAVGYDLYCKMLNEAVRTLKGEEVESFVTTIDLNVDAFIPDTYITGEQQKLDVYKRIASIESEEEKEEMTEELIDRYGDLPKRVETLLRVSLLKSEAHRCYVTDLEQKGDMYIFRMYEQAKIDPLKLPDFLNGFHGDLKIRTDKKQPEFVYCALQKNTKRTVDTPLEIVEKVLIAIKGLLEN